MTSTRPYLIRAIHEWLLDNDLTPHLLVDVTVEGVDVPVEYSKDGRIALNISPGATEALTMDNTGIGFRARFGGVATEVYLPVGAVRAIYARENGRGMVFGEQDDEPEPGGDDDGGSTAPRRPALKVVK